MARTVMCFGDSLTWGYNPADGSRFPYEQRWPGVMAATLGERYRVIEEGLVGRTTVMDSPFFDNRSGKAVLAMLLESHAPLDAVVLMLGSNDLNLALSLAAPQVAWGCAGLLKIIQTSCAGPRLGQPRVLLVTPPPFGQLRGATALGFAGKEDESRKIHAAYAGIAAAFGVASFNAGQVCQASAVDGAHLDASGHQALGTAIAEQLHDLLA